jgi:hypothetical protein
MNKNKINLGTLPTIVVARSKTHLYRGKIGFHSPLCMLYHLGRSKNSFEKQFFCGKLVLQYQSLQLFLHSCGYAVVFCDYIHSDEVATTCNVSFVLCSTTSATEGQDRILHQSHRG